MARTKFPVRFNGHLLSFEESEKFRQQYDGKIIPLEESERRRALLYNVPDTSHMVSNAQLNRR